MIRLSASLLILSLCFGTATAQTSDTIKIATFNIQIFGKTKASKPDILSQLAEIVREFDLVAVQEIKDKSGSTPPKFLSAINSAAAQYDDVVSERTGEQQDDASSREQYGYFFNTTTVQKMDDGVLYDDSLSDHFQREPFVARFKVKNGNFTFVLITIHTKPTRALKEIRALEFVVEWARGRYPDEDDFLVLGDFNADCTYASADELDTLGLSGDQFIWIVPHSADTTVSPGTDCAYDRIVTTWGTDEDFTGNWGIHNVFADKKVSDHWPVWAEFHVNRDGSQH